MADPPTSRASPGGAWTPAPATPWAPPPLYLADDVDVGSGELRSITRGAHPVDAWIVTQLRTIRGSGSVVQDDGHLFGQFEIVDDGAQDLAAAEVERLLRPAIERGDVELLTVSVEEFPDADGVAVEVVYRNLRSGAGNRTARASVSTRPRVVRI